MISGRNSAAISSSTCCGISAFSDLLRSKVSVSPHLVGKLFLSSSYCLRYLMYREVPCVLEAFRPAGVPLKLVYHIEHTFAITFFKVSVSADTSTCQSKPVIIVIATTEQCARGGLTSIYAELTCQSQHRFVRARPLTTFRSFLPEWSFSLDILLQEHRTEPYRRILPAHSGL